MSIPALNLNSNTVSITAWVKRDGDQVLYAPVVFTRGYEQDPCDPNDILPESNTTVGFGLGSTADPYWEANYELCYHWADAENSWSWHNELIVPDDVWTFIALTVAPDVASMYISDGTTVKSARNFAYHEPEEFDGTVYLGWDPIDISPYIHTTERHFSGVVDDVRIYDYTLTPGEVIYIAGLSGSHYLPLEPWRADTDKDDNKVDLIDYAVLADYWLEEILFPIP